MKKTIIILSHVVSKDSLYCDYVHSHAKELVKKGYNVIVIACINYFPFLSFFNKTKKEIYELHKDNKEQDGVKIIYKRKLSISNLFKKSKINFNGILYYFAIKNIVKKIISENNVILIDAHTFKNEGYAAYKIKKNFNISTFVTCHGSSFNDCFLTKNGQNLIKKIGKNIDYFVCVSDKIKRQINTIGLNNVKVIYNGINFYKKNGIIKKNNIITVGSLTSDKNIDLVISSFNNVINFLPNTKLIVIGNGPEKENLKKLSNNNPNIVFLGKLPNKEVYKYLEENLIFLLPSSPEGFGIVYAEAMYNGCITIGTKNEGIDGFIKNGENGFLVNIDEKEITELILKILNNPTKYSNIQNNAISSIQKLTWENNVNQYLELLGENDV